MELGPNPEISISDKTSFDLLCFSNIVSIIDSFLHAKGPTEVLIRSQRDEEDSKEVVVITNNKMCSYWTTRKTLGHCLITYPSQMVVSHALSHVQRFECSAHNIFLILDHFIDSLMIESRPANNKKFAYATWLSLVKEMRHIFKTQAVRWLLHFQIQYLNKIVEPKFTTTKSTDVVSQ